MLRSLLRLAEDWAGLSNALDTAALDPEWQPLIKQIIQMDRAVLHRNANAGLWTRIAEVACYLSNRETTAVRFASAIRGHWRAENTLHYTRDVTFLEDQSHIRTNQGIFARMRSFAYNILCRNQTSSFNQDRYAAAVAGPDASLNWVVS